MTKKQALGLLSAHFSEPVTVRKSDGFPTLFIGDRAITSGSEEVSQRIKQLIKENGLQYHGEG